MQNVRRNRARTEGFEFSCRVNECSGSRLCYAAGLWGKSLFDRFRVEWLGLDDEGTVRVKYSEHKHVVDYRVADVRLLPQHFGPKTSFCPRRKATCCCDKLLNVPCLCFGHQSEGKLSFCEPNAAQSVFCGHSSVS